MGYEDVDVLDIFNFLDRESSKILLYCILNRYPIFVVGDNEGELNQIISNLTNFIDFRHDVAFYTAISTEEEVYNIVFNEDKYPDYPRKILRCDSFYHIAIRFLLNTAINLTENRMDPKMPMGAKEQIRNTYLKTYNERVYKGWIFALNNKQLEEFEENFYKIKMELNLGPNINLDFKRLIIHYGEHSKIEPLNFENISSIDFSFEEEILNKMDMSTDQIKGLVSKMLKDSLPPEIYEVLGSYLELDRQIYELRRMIMKTEIEKFYSGAKNIFYVLNRLRIVEQKFKTQIKPVLSIGALLEIIDLPKRIKAIEQKLNIFKEEAPVEKLSEQQVRRMLDFIRNEWGQDLEQFIDFSARALGREKALRGLGMFMETRSKRISPNLKENRGKVEKKGTFTKNPSDLDNFQNKIRCPPNHNLVRKDNIFFCEKDRKGIF